MKGINNDYPLLPFGEITDEARLIAVRWGDEYFPGIALPEKHKLASDIMNYARRHNANKQKELLEELIFSLQSKVHTDSDIDYQIAIADAVEILKSKLK